MNNPKLNAQNGAFGDTPGINPALETAAKPADSTKALHNRIAELEEQNRNLLTERSQRLEAETGFHVIAGKYETIEGNQCHNIKVADGPLTFEAALARFLELESYPFCYIEYKQMHLIAFPQVLEQAA